jgi:signal transduction histidine kinase
VTAELLHRLLPLLALALNLVLLGGALAADRKSPRNVVFAFFACALGVWNLGVFGLRATADPVVALVWERFLHVGVVPIPILFYHYVLAFLDLPRRRSLVIGYVLCGAFLAASPTAAFMTGVRETPWGFVPAAGPLYAPFFVYFQACLVAGLVQLVRAYGTVQASFRKNRTLLVILGAAVSIGGGAVDFARFIVGWERLYPFGIPSNAVFALALGVALVRYRLMDLGVLAKRSVLYLLASLALAPPLFAALYGLHHLAPPAEGAGDAGGDLRDAVVLLAGMGLALPLLRRLQAALDRLIFQRQHGVRDALVGLSKDLPSILDLRTLAATLASGLVTRVPVRHAALHLADDAGAFPLFASAVAGDEEADHEELTLDDRLVLWLKLHGRTLSVEEIAFRAGLDARMRTAVHALESGRIALIVPLFLEGELRAALVVGEKLSGELFDADEMELLETLVGQTAVALKNARLYESLIAQMQAQKRTQAQLLQSAKLAAVGELAASVAHEINNPLMVILGYTALLGREFTPDSPAREKLEMVEAQANRAGKIVRDLLDFARRREPNFEPLDIHDVIARALALVEAKVTAGGVEVQRVFDPDVPRILGDRDQLTQVFLNLAGNAVDAMPDGGTLVVRTAVQAVDSVPVLRIDVTDTGVGMDAEQAARIFEPFYTTKPEGQGTGLGLSVSVGIVQRHGGTLSAESAPGKGTTMTVLLGLPPRAEWSAGASVPGASVRRRVAVHGVGVGGPPERGVIGEEL